MINPGEIKTIIGKGFPFYDNDTHSGNLHIKFNILFPSEINLDQKNIIKNTFEGKYMQYITHNENNDINKNKNNNINKGNWKKNFANKKKNENGINQNKKTFAPKISNINKMKNKNSNNFFNKSDSNNNNQKTGINKMNENEKEKAKQNNINNLEILELVKFDETMVNKGYFYEKNN